MLKILKDSLICFLQILSMPTLLSEMPYFRIIAFLFIMVRFYNYLAIVWRTSIQLVVVLCIEFGGFHGELITICYLILLVWFAKRYRSKCISICMKSDNNTIKTISMMGVFCFRCKLYLH